MYRHLCYFILIILISCISVSATSLSDLIIEFRERVGEPDSSESFFSDSTVEIWLNMAQYKIMTVGNLYEKYSVYEYNQGDGHISLPSDLRKLKEVWINLEDTLNRKWYGPYPPLSVNPYDSINIQFSVRWLTAAVPELIIKPGNVCATFTDISYHSDSVAYSIPADFNSVSAVTVRQRAEWNPVVNNLGFVIDTNLFQYFIAWDDVDTARFYFHDMYKPRHISIIYNSDSIKYTLPVNFRILRGVAFYSSFNEGWSQALENPYFSKDTTATTYFIDYPNPDTAWMYFESQEVTDGDTIRVWYDGLSMANNDTIRIFYNRMIVSGDSVKVVYFATPGSLDDDSTTFRIDYDPFIIEEAMLYYEQAKQNFQASQAIWQQIRIDLGLLRPQGEPQR